MMLRMGSVPAAVYSQRERLAIVLAYDPPRVSARAVAERAEAGRLVDADGKLVEPFSCAVASVRSISMRARRNGVLHEQQGDVDLEASKKLYAKLSARARRLVEEAKSEEEIKRASRMLRELQELEGTLARAPASNGRPGGLSGEILRAHREVGQPTSPHRRSGSAGDPPGSPEPPPTQVAKVTSVTPEPEPQPESDPREEPGRWMRAEIERFQREQASQRQAEVSAARSASHGAVDDDPGTRSERAWAAALERKGLGAPTLDELRPRRRRQIGGMPRYGHPSEFGFG